MPRFLAVYTMKHADFARFHALPKSEQDAINTAGVPLFEAWNADNAAAMADPGGMVGKNRRVTREGITDTPNELCGYLIVQAETIEAAAHLFENHPHFAVFPGDGVDIMPLVTGPAD